MLVDPFVHLLIHKVKYFRLALASLTRYLFPPEPSKLLLTLPKLSLQAYL